MNQQSTDQEIAGYSAFPIVSTMLTLLFISSVSHADQPTRFTDDPHYTPVGFFDMHVCNWTDRPNFFLIVFTTERFNEIKSVDVTRPNGQFLMGMDLSRHRVMLRKNKPEKRAFIEQFSLPSDASNGWYTARITLHNGEVYIAKDYIINYIMPAASGIIPPDGSKNITVPTALKWDPVPGAAFYKVYIKDVWEGKEIYESKLLSTPLLELPPDLIKPESYYSWRIHARDVNENILLGDFNHGSFTGENKFSTAEK
mgnify:CR=1 FL=1